MSQTATMFTSPTSFLRSGEIGQQTNGGIESSLLAMLRRTAHLVNQRKLTPVTVARVPACAPRGNGPFVVLPGSPWARRLHPARPRARGANLGDTEKSTAYFMQTIALSANMVPKQTRIFLSLYGSAGCGVALELPLCLRWSASSPDPRTAAQVGVVCERSRRGERQAPAKSPA